MGLCRELSLRRYVFACAKTCLRQPSERLILVSFVKHMIKPCSNWLYGALEWYSCVKGVLVRFPVVTRISALAVEGSAIIRSASYTQRTILPAHEQSRERQGLNHVH